MEKNGHISESIRLGTLLTLTGGFMDAYSYLIRGGTFANAETGNIVLMGLSLAEGKWMRALYYLVPVVAFALGIFAAERIRERVGENPGIHWKEGVLWAEILLLFLAGFLPQEYNAVVNSMIAFSCAMQVEAFRKIRGKAFATTMCTGNLRSGTELLCSGDYRHDAKRERKACIITGLTWCSQAALLSAFSSAGLLASGPSGSAASHFSFPFFLSGTRSRGRRSKGLCRLLIFLRSGCSETARLLL